MVGNRNDTIKWLLEAPEGTYRVEVFHETRSGAANRYFHRLIGLLAKGQRANFYKIKNEAITSYGNHELERGKDGKAKYTLLPDDDEWKSDPTYHYVPTKFTDTFQGKQYRAFCLFRGTSTYNSAEMAHLIECVREECIGCGIPVEEVETFEERQLFLGLKKNATKENKKNVNTKIG